MCEMLKTKHLHGKLLAYQTIVQRSASSNDLFHNRGTVKPMNFSDSVGATFAQMDVSSYHHVFPSTIKTVPWKRLCMQTCKAQRRHFVQ